MSTETQPHLSSTTPLHDNDINEMASGAIVATFGKFVGRGLQALTQIILARYLGPAIFGVFALGWTIFRILGAFAPLGLNQGVIRFGIAWVGTNNPKFRGVFNTAVSTGLLSSTAMGLLLFSSAPFIADLLNNPELIPVLWLFSATIPLLTVIKIISATLQTTRNMKPSVLMEDFSQPALFFVLIIVILLIEGGVNIVTTAVFLSYFVAVGFGLYLLTQTFPHFFSWQAEYDISRSEIVKFSLPTALAGIFTLLTIWTDRLFLGYFLTSNEVGIYQAISQSSILFAVILQGISAIFTPIIATLYQQNKMVRLNELYKISTRWAVYLAIPLLLIIIVAPINLMTVVFGDAYLAGVPSLIILTVGQFVNLSTGTVGFILLMTGYERRWFNVSIASFILNIILNIVLIPRFGIAGAAWATAVSVSFLYVTGLIIVYSIHQLWPYNSQYLKGVVATTITLVCLIIFNQLPLASQLLYLVGNLLIATIVFLTALYFLGFAEEDKIFVNLIQNRVTQTNNES